MLTDFLGVLLSYYWCVLYSGSKFISWLSFFRISLHNSSIKSSSLRYHFTVLTWNQLHVNHIFEPIGSQATSVSSEMPQLNVWDIFLQNHNRSSRTVCMCFRSAPMQFSFHRIYSRRLCVTLCNFLVAASPLLLSVLATGGQRLWCHTMKALTVSRAAKLLTWQVKPSWRLNGCTCVSWTPQFAFLSQNTDVFLVWHLEGRLILTRVAEFSSCKLHTD